MNTELALAILIFTFSLVAVFVDFKRSLYILLIISVLLHKELFSFYRWDLLPVRIFMSAVGVYGLVVGARWLRNSQNRLAELKRFLYDPLVLTLLMLWCVRGASLFFSKNLEASILLFGFYTTVLIFIFLLVKELYNDPDLALRLINRYILIAVVLGLFTFVQLLLYFKYNFIVGALWVIPDHTPRVGSLFWDVNHFAGFVAALLPVIGIFILTSVGMRRKVGYLVAFVILFAVLLLTNSRTAWLIAAFSGFFFVTSLLVRRFGLRAILYVLAVLFILSIPFFIEYSDRSSPFRARIKQYFHYRIDSFDSHLLLLNGAFEVFEKYPVLGGGYGSFFEQFSKTETAAEFFGRDPAGLNVRVPAHTIWGESLAETGALGFYFTGILFLVLLGVPLYGALTLQNRREYLHLAGIASAVFGWFLGGGIFYSYNSEFFWIILALYYVYSVGVLGKNYHINEIISYYFRHHNVGFLIICVTSVALLFLGLGTNHLIPWDEAIYAKISKNMFLSGSYLDLVWLKATPWLEKPPLYMWGTALFFKLLGINEWAVRMTSALAGLSTVVLVYYFGKTLFNKTAAFVAALSLLTTFHFLYYSRTGMIDVTLTFFITLSMFLFWQARSRNLYLLWALTGAAIGFAILTKGLVGVLPLIVIFAFEMLANLKGIFGHLKENYLKYALLVVLAFAVAGPWHLLMVYRHGAVFLNTYLGYHVIQRAIADIEDKGRPLYWYLTVIKVSMRIWFLALIPSFVLGVFMALKKSHKMLMLVLWFLIIFVFFSIAKSKLIWYMIPVYPAASLMIGFFVWQVIDFVSRKFAATHFYAIKGIALYSIFVFSIIYLFIERELVYTSDLTGPQTILVQEKDKIFGTKETLYADRVELPLMLFYSNSEFEIVDFGPLQTKLQIATYGEQVVFITKESRFRKLKGLFPSLDMEASEKEWVLGYLPSEKELDEKSLKEVLDTMSELEEYIVDSTESQTNVDASVYTRLADTKTQAEIIRKRLENPPY